MKALLDHFDLVATAPGGAARLRKLTLELAVHGKLVPQDPTDEPASVLLENIKSEKARIFKEGKIKVGKELPPIAEDEKPYVLPKGWEWVRLGEIADQVNGKAFKPSDWVPIGLPIVRIQNLNNPSAAYNFCNEEKIESKYLIKADELLISWSGTPGTSFGAFRWRGSKAALNQHINRVVLFGERNFNKDYFVAMINSQLDFLIGSARGAVGLRHVTMGQLDRLCVPLPPLPEQARIVARVQELMAVLERVEARNAAAEDGRVRALLASTRALPQAGTRTSLAAEWRRLAEGFDGLVRRKDDVKALRAMVLELAVHGKLVPQDPSDEPASVLLQKIKAEKARLVEEGKIKVGKELPPISEDEKPYELPKGWEWVRFGEIGSLESGGTPSSSNTKYWEPAEVLWVCPRDMKCEVINTTTDMVSRLVISDGVLGIIGSDSILIVVRGMILVRKVPVAISGVALTTNQDIKALVPYLVSVVPFIKTALEGMNNGLLSLVERSSHGTCKLETPKLMGFVLPLPPLAEQARIVARVQEFMRLLDHLEDKLAKTEAAAVAFADLVATV